MGVEPRSSQAARGGGQIAFLGGVNINSSYSSGSFTGSKPRIKGARPSRDTHLRIEGPAVSEFQKLFRATWEKQKGSSLKATSFFPQTGKRGEDIVRVIGSSPDEPYSQIYATLLSAINSAETYAYITSAYFVPDSQLLEALKSAVRREVDVRLLLPGKTDSGLAFYASHSYYDELLSGGVKIYERQDALLHAKTALIDRVWSTVGSTNLDWLSFLHNQEVNAVILGPEFGAQMRAVFNRDISYPLSSHLSSGVAGLLPCELKNSLHGCGLAGFNPTRGCQPSRSKISNICMKPQELSLTALLPTAGVPSRLAFANG
jgi:cardiolipin synthase